MSDKATLFRDHDYGAMGIAIQERTAVLWDHNLVREDADTLRGVLSRYAVQESREDVTERWTLKRDTYAPAMLNAIIAEMRRVGYSSDRLSERAILDLSVDEAQRPDLPNAKTPVVHEAVERGVRQHLTLAVASLRESAPCTPPSLSFYERPHATRVGVQKPPFVVARMFTGPCEMEDVRRKVIESLKPLADSIVKVSVTEADVGNAVEVGLALPPVVMESYLDAALPVFEHDVTGGRDVIIQLDSPVNEQALRDLTELAKTTTAVTSLVMEHGAVNALIARVPSGFVGPHLTDRALMERLDWLCGQLSPWGAHVYEVGELTEVSAPAPTPERTNLVELGECEHHDHAGMKTVAMLMAEEDREELLAGSGLTEREAGMVTRCWDYELARGGTPSSFMQRIEERTGRSRDELRTILTENTPGFLYNRFREGLVNLARKLSGMPSLETEAKTLHRMMRQHKGDVRKYREVRSRLSDMARDVLTSGGDSKLAEFVLKLDEYLMRYMILSGMDESVSEADAMRKTFFSKPGVISGQIAQKRNGTKPADAAKGNYKKMRDKWRSRNAVPKKNEALDENADVANTIMKQIRAGMGGLDYMAMGIKRGSVYSSKGGSGIMGAMDVKGPGVQFDVRGHWKGRVIVRLDLGRDTYTVIFGRVRGANWKIDKRLDDVYADSLGRIIRDNVLGNGIRESVELVEADDRAFRSTVKAIYREIDLEPGLPSSYRNTYDRHLKAIQSFWQAQRWPQYRAQVGSLIHDMNKMGVDDYEARELLNLAEAVEPHNGGAPKAKWAARGKQPMAEADGDLLKRLMAPRRQPSEMEKAMTVEARKWKGKILTPPHGADMTPMSRREKRSAVEIGNNTNVVRFDRSMGWYIQAPYFDIKPLLRKGFTVVGLGTLKGLPGWFVFEHRPVSATNAMPQLRGIMSQAQKLGESVDESDAALRDLERRASTGGPEARARYRRAMRRSGRMKQLTIANLRKARAMAQEMGGPFRAPHYTASPSAIRGEIGMAQGGVLFLDELGSFSQEAIKLLAREVSGSDVTVVVDHRVVTPGYRDKGIAWDKNMAILRRSLGESVDEAVVKRKKMEAAIFRKFPRGNKGKIGGKKQVMFTGPLAKTMGRDSFSRVNLEDLTNAEVEKLAKAVKAIQPEDELAEYRPDGARDESVLNEGNPTTAQLKSLMKKAIKASSAQTVLQIAKNFVGDPNKTVGWHQLQGWERRDLAVEFQRLIDAKTKRLQQHQLDMDASLRYARRND